ncbi:MAG: nickel pincer cofactor biosynthesis protein LarB, partial [Planctomycetes bacterium]|nr:nickel pincer cofactor biosynthesis protein LarB [Planctomycetota bacterium]
QRARCITVAPPELERHGHVAVVAAGTADLPVADEAAVTLAVAGNRVERYNDVGVAGLHRLTSKLAAIRRAEVAVAVAGMEGALPSVLAGLVDFPVIAVPTSVGYGASFGGLAALLAMLNSCAAGVAVVNVDNGFGAGYLAALVNRRVARATTAPTTEPISKPAHDL